jgi:hypothetical protein
MSGEKKPELIIHLFDEKTWTYVERVRVAMEPNSNVGAGIRLPGYKAVGLTTRADYHLFTDVTVTGVKGDPDGLHIFLTNRRYGKEADPQ